MEEQELQVDKWMVVSPAESEEVQVLETDSKQPIASVYGKDFREKFARAMLIARTPALVETLQLTYWLFKGIAPKTSDPRMAAAIGDFLPTIEGTLHNAGGLGENPFRDD